MELTKGQKAAKTLKAKDPDYFAKLGSKGGKANHKVRHGFQDGNRAVEAGKKRHENRNNQNTVRT